MTSAFRYDTGMICFDRGTSRFNFRVGGICLSQGRLLLESDSRYDFFVVPGGRCEFHESTSDCLAREIKEEVGTEATVGRLLWVVENFFRLDGKDFHEIGFYYEVSLPPGDAVCRREGTFPGAEGNNHLAYQWVSFDKARTLKVFPSFLAERLAALPTHTEHVIIDQR